jgi:Tol biopolymer transport system component
MRLVMTAVAALALSGSVSAPAGRIAFSAGPLEPGHSNVYVYDLGSKTVTRLTHDQGVHFDPAFSPYGSRVAFRSRIGPEDYEIRIVNVDGTGLRNLSNNGAMDYAPAWSPDGKKIAFASERRFGVPHVWVMDADGSDPHVLTRAFTGEYPSWAPNGRRIVYATNAQLTDSGFEIVVVNADGTHARRLTHNATNDMGPVWSPNGRWIAFESARASRRRLNDVYVMRPNGSHIRRVTRGGGELPTWSPDGKWVAYASPRGLELIRPDGTGKRKLSLGLPLANFPSWARS